MWVGHIRESFLQVRRLTLQFVGWARLRWRWEECSSPPATISVYLIPKLRAPDASVSSGPFILTSSTSCHSSSWMVSLQQSCLSCIYSTNIYESRPGESLSWMLYGRGRMCDKVREQTWWTLSFFPFHALGGPCQSICVFFFLSPEVARESLSLQHSRQAQPTDWSWHLWWNLLSSSR